MKSIIRAKTIMVQGTSSHVGKSLIVAGLCRIFKDMGLNVAPFKAQNMALNSAVTIDGAEIGRAQAFQALCANVAPSVDMNPILLKPTGEARGQVIIHGKVYSDMSAREYHAFKPRARSFVKESFERLSSSYDMIVIEGAGSPAEVNLRENDLANMGIAEMFDCPVVLVGDIDRGGVFASLVGTLELLTIDERRRVKGLIINKFRGDITLLEPGLEFLKGRTGLPMLGVIPYIKDLLVPEEDGVSLGLGGAAGVQGRASNERGARIAVVKLPRISNFTDFDPLLSEPGVRVDFIGSIDGIDNANAIILPGSKNTMEDLAWLKEKGFAEAIKGHLKKARPVIGICGGLQMLGHKVKDPLNVEGGGEVLGLGLLPIETTMQASKQTFEARAVLSGAYSKQEVGGYEIHMGDTCITGDAVPFSRITKRGKDVVDVPDGAVGKDGLVWGTYLHGIFDNDSFRSEFLKGLDVGKGDFLRPARSFAGEQESSIARLAEVVLKSLDMEGLLCIAGLTERLKT